MGKNLLNELWARPVPLKLSERRPPLLFLGADTENGEKTGSFRISANYSDAKAKALHGIAFGYQCTPTTAQKHLDHFLSCTFK